MTNAIANTQAGNMVVPAHLRRNTALDGKTAEIVNVASAKPMVKMTGGTLSLHIGAEKPVRKQLIMVDADGMKERVSDMMDVVIVGYTDVLYAHYKRGQALGEGAPICVSVGGKVPHPRSPSKQSNACKGCPQNTDGSGNDGRGKACSKRGIAVAFDVNDPKHKLFAIQMPTKSYYFSPENQPGWFGFKDLILHLNKNEVPIYHLITRVKVSPDGEYFRMDFMPVDWVSETIAEVVNNPATADELTDMREYFEYAKEDAFSTPNAQPSTTPAGTPGQVQMVQLLELVSSTNPAIAAGARQALAGMGIIIPETASAPVVQQPAPVVQQPAPVVQQPAPVVQQPAPVVQQAAPVVQQAAPVVQPVIEGELVDDPIAAAAAFLSSIGAA